MLLSFVISGGLLWPCEDSRSFGQLRRARQIETTGARTSVRINARKINGHWIFLDLASIPTLLRTKVRAPASLTGFPWHSYFAGPLVICADSHFFFRYSLPR